MGNSVPTRVCPYCTNEKPWVFSGKKLKDGSKVYTNEFAVRWAGRRCPDCERVRVQAAVKCDRFERDQVIEQLGRSGYQVRGSTLPLTVEKDGEILSLEVRHARMHEGTVGLSKPPKRKADLYALVFSSIRIISAAQMESLEAQSQMQMAQKEGKREQDGADKQSPAQS